MDIERGLIPAFQQNTESMEQLNFKSDVELEKKVCEQVIGYGKDFLVLNFSLPSGWRKNSRRAGLSRELTSWTERAPMTAGSKVTDTDQSLI